MKVDLGTSEEVLRIKITSYRTCNWKLPFSRTRDYNRVKVQSSKGFELTAGMFIRQICHFPLECLSHRISNLDGYSLI